MRENERYVIVDLLRLLHVRMEWSAHRLYVFPSIVLLVIESVKG